MDETKQKSKLDIKTAAILLIILAVLVAIFIYLNGYELYIGGVVIYNVLTLVGIIFEIIVLLVAIIESIKNIKKTDDSKTKKKIKGYIIGISIFTILMTIFTGHIVASNVNLSNSAAIAEREIGDGKSILLMENEEKYSSSDESYYMITIYYRDGIRLKEIGKQDEIFYSHNNMVKNGQFEVEKSGDSVKIHYDYGELVNGLKWNDEYSDNPPQYIDKEYKLK